MMKRTYIPREIEPAVRRLATQFPALALTGPRQSGKSTLLKHLFAKEYNYISFDDPVMREQAASDPRFFLENAGKKVILDEIQYVPELLSYVKMMVDEKRQENGRFIFTGSQQFHLIKELGDSLAGRIALLELLPFSVSEKKKVFPKSRFSTTRQYFEDACLRGSFPQIVTASADFDRAAWYGAYLQTYLERDIRTIYDIGNLRDFQRLLYFLAGRCSQILHLSSAATEIGISVNTVKRWLSVLEASRIIYLVQPYYKNFGKRLSKSPKLYFLDCGLLCHLLSLKDAEYFFKGPMAGPLFENFCIQETVKTLTHTGRRAQVYYLRTHNGLEVDMLLEDGTHIFPVECKLSKTPRGEMGKPMERLRALFPKWDIGQGVLLTLSEQSKFLSRDVKILSFLDYIDWLKDFTTPAAPPQSKGRPQLHRSG